MEGMKVLFRLQVFIECLFFYSSVVLSSATRRVRPNTYLGERLLEGTYYTLEKRHKLWNRADIEFESSFSTY